MSGCTALDGLAKHAHVLVDEPASTPDQVRGGLSLEHALVPRTRSSHDFSAGTIANFGFKSGTRIMKLPVSLSIPKFAQRSPRMLANFGIGTLAPASIPLPFRGVRGMEVT
jgi:hypothetical protein